MHRSLIVIISGLLGSMVVGQVSAQVTTSPPDANGLPPQNNVASDQAGVLKRGTVITLRVSRKHLQLGPRIDFVNAKPLELPGVPRRSDLQAHYDLMDALRSQPALGQPGYSAGRRGNGARNPTKVGVPSAWAGSPGHVAPQEYGTLTHPFTTAQADGSGQFQPYAASGKLFFNIGGDTYMCSASLIKRGVVVTAAHCVAQFGAQQFYSNWNFIPAYNNGDAPYGIWTATSATVLTAYYDGTDSCAVAGIVCQDDVAVLLLNASQTGDYPGTAAGWYGYGWNGFGFTANGFAQITQIGYPVCLDNGALMERNDSFGYTSSVNSNNTVIGSLMCGGSSGGPWLVNFGIRPVLTETVEGVDAGTNMVVGVTSWGYTTTAEKEQGASPFSSSNIVPIVNAACAMVPAACT